MVAHEKRNSGQLFCTVPTRNDLALSSLLFSAQPTQKLGYPFPGPPPLDGGCRLPYNGAKPPPPSPGEKRTYTMKKALIVVDMQKDFVDGSLGTPAAQSIVPAVVEKIRAFRGDALLVTLDTHGADYLQTLEGKKLPVPHCIKGTPGHALHSEIQAALSGKPHTLVEKNTFGSFDVARLLAERFPGETPEIELVGLCTDICVLSNALLLRAAFPNAPITVDARCCAGVTEDAHRAALTAMQSCQIDILAL